VTTQLRLVEPPEPRVTASSKSGPKASTRAAAKASTKASARGPRRATVVRSGRTGRPAVKWGDWRLDAQTRQVGRAGVARAREALEAAADQEFSQAS